MYSKKQREERLSTSKSVQMVYNCNVPPASHAVVDRKKQRILASSIRIAPLRNWRNIYIYLKNTPVNRHSLYFHIIPPLLLYPCNLITVLLVNREPQETMLLCWSVACSGMSHCRHIPESSVNLNYTYGHQNWCGLAECNQIYKHAKLEGFALSFSEIRPTLLPNRITRHQYISVIVCVYRKSQKIRTYRTSRKMPAPIIVFLTSDHEIWWQSPKVVWTVKLIKGRPFTEFEKKKCNIKVLDSLI